MNDLAALRGPRKVLFGAGQRAALGATAAEIGSHALVCTDARLADTAEFATMLDDLRSSGVSVTVYGDAHPEVPVHQAQECLDAAGAGKPDMVIGMGGGSCLDLAKVAAVLLAHGGTPQNYYGEMKVPGPTIPVLAVPTTAGTGSEVTPVAVVSDPERSLKVGISSPYLIPHTAICDPELTYGSPPALTASVGADALSHAVEAFTAVRKPQGPRLTTEQVFVGKGAFTDQYALMAIGLIAEHLQRACAEPEDPVARGGMMLAATAGGFALGTAGTAAAHAIQYPIGTLTQTPHGVGVGALLPYVMDFNLAERVPEFRAIGAAMGVPDSGRDGDQDARAAVDAVEALLHSVGIPGTLRELGLPEDRIGWTAEHAMAATRLVANNPRALRVEDVETIVRRAYHGDRAGRGE